MNLFKKIALSILVGASLHSCSCSDQQEQVSEEEAGFVGTWKNESEVEILGFTFLPQEESLTLNEDKSFLQSFTYFDENSKYDTIAIVSVKGTWELADNCLEMSYDTTSVAVKCEDSDIIDIFTDDIMGNIKLNNDELTKAHEEGSQYGIQNAVIKDDKLISKENIEDEDGEIIYTKAK